MKNRARRRALIGVLVDPALKSEEDGVPRFLGAADEFSAVGPFRMASILGRPIVMMSACIAATAATSSSRPSRQRPRTNRPSRRCGAMLSGSNTTAAAGHTIGSISMISGHDRGQATNLGMVAQAHRRSRPFSSAVQHICRPTDVGNTMGIASTHGQHAWRAHRFCPLRRATIRAIAPSSAANPPARWSLAHRTGCKSRP